MAHVVTDIARSGFFLLTTERWLIGTLIMMTLQRTSQSPEDNDCSIIVLSKVVRHGADGVGFEFVPVEGASQGQSPTPGSNAADKKMIDKFFQLLSLEGKDRSL